MSEDTREHDGPSAGSGQGSGQRPDSNAEELRYEGPITFDDEDIEDEYEDGPGRRTFLTTAIIFAAVVVIVGTALWMRSDDSAEADRLTELTPPPAASAEGVEPLPYGSVGAADEAAASEMPPVDYRPVPEETMAAAEPPASQPVETAEASPPPPVAPPVTRPAPRPAGLRDAEPEAPAELDPLQIGALARSGQVRQAAELAARIARSGNPADWTLQLMVACQAETVSRAFDKVRDGELSVLPYSYRGRNCYRLTWGSYPSRQAAESRASGVPAYFGDKPRPANMASILP